jgi:hypothetical protein
MRPLKTVSINLSNVAGALQGPRGMTVNCHSPYPVKKAVFSLSEREPFTSSQRVQSVINQWQWETTLPCDIVWFPVVYAEAQVTVLPDEDGG